MSMWNEGTVPFPPNIVFGMGAVLSQMQDGEERVIAYVSKSLEGSEQRYCTARKELLAVVQQDGLR